MSTVSTNKVDAKLQNIAEKASSQNFTNGATDVLGKFEKATESQSKNFEESLKKL